MENILTDKKNKILITGANGQLGRDLIKEFNERKNFLIAGTDLQEKYSGDETCEYLPVDITNYEAVENLFMKIKPDRVIHCAAWTAVDAAEDENNKNIVWNVNVIGTENISKACKKFNCVMTYISTDYIFNGQGSEAWKPDDEKFKPLNYYGLSKLNGEFAVKKYLDKYFIVRIAWVFGQNGNNFVKTMLKLAEKYKTLRVVNDQIGTPTYTPDLAKLLADMNLTEKFGIYHATNEGGFISWYDFACEIFKQANININIIPVSTAEYGLSKAERPFNSRLDKRKLSENGFKLLPDWRDALRRYLLNANRN